MKHFYKLHLFIVVLVIAQYGYASCSSEWLSCRKAARQTQKECKSACADSQQCETECENDMDIEYADCDTAKSECLNSEESQYPSAQSPYHEPQRSIPASICATNFGSCPMVVPVTRGTSCYCMTPAGQIWGIAQ